MKSIRIALKPCSRNGSVLAISIFLILLAGMASVLMTKTLIDHQRVSARRHDLWRAFNLAEAGVAQVQQWALFPDSFTVDTTLFVPDLVASASTSTSTGFVNSYANFQEKYPDLYAAINASSTGYVIDEAALDTMGGNQLSTKNGVVMGKFVNIRLIPPDVSDPVNCLFKIESTGRSLRGTERTVLCYANLNSSTYIKIPAALISFVNLAVKGNAKVHWGEAWSRNNMAMASQNDYNYISTDPLAVWRTQGQINEWGGGWRVDTALNPDILTTQNDMGVPARYAGRFLQNQAEADFPTEWPTFDYESLKNHAISHRRYYSTNSAGDIFRDGVEDDAHRVDFLTEFGIGNQDTAPYDMVFIDTVDGNPPESDGSNLATISISGNSIGVKGVFYIGANFDASGIGSPPSLTVDDPNDISTVLEKIFMNGVMYSAGTMALSGNAGVYGSVVSQMGFTGTGTPDVYYNSDLADGLELGNGNVGSIFRIDLINNYG